MEFIIKIKKIPEWLEEMYNSGKLRRNYRFKQKILFIVGGKIRRRINGNS